MRARRASLAKARDPLLEPLQRALQARSRGGQFLQFGAAHEDACFLGGVIGERLGEPRRAVEHMVREKRKGHRRGGLCAGQPRPQCICWMPASSHPEEPSAGLTRFQTSAKPTASLPGVSRSMPEKRTLAQYLSFSVAT